MAVSEEEEVRQAGKGSPQIIKDDEIDLVALFRFIWDGRRVIIKSIAVFFIFGLVIALLSPKEYTTTVKLVPESSKQSGLGSLGSLASQFGLGGLGQAGDLSEGIPPEYYPEIMKSLPFMDSLLHYTTYMEGPNDTISLYEYFAEYQKSLFLSQLKKYTIQLPFTILGALKSQEPPVMEEGKSWVQFTKEEWKVIENLKERLSVEMDKKTGMITITATMPEAVLVADVANEATELLVAYIKDYRTQKAREDLEFVRGSMEEALQRFEKAQKTLAAFRDESHGQLTAMARTREQRLQSEYDLTYNVYSALAKRLEEARIKLQEETPVVKVIEPAAVPEKKSAPKRILILIMSVFLGGFMGVGLIFGRLVLRKFQFN
ncbi:MAG: lipopolysaccharide biosynthesis protein [Candidatus Atribacteria bacterium]|nr:lipopolysaccharide biosynthesis protein [Candidatus Atribacteria bacterium]